MNGAGAATAERFAADAEALLARAPSADAPLALAVSGGPDSMAMLALAHAAFPGAAIAATVDHGLRPEAAGEAAMVAEWCAAHGVPHATLRIALPPGGNIQGAARERRYAALAEWAGRAGAIALATAHHADDQAETFLMRATRGAGPSGLAGVRARRMLGALPLIRPLLGWRRAELRAAAEAAGAGFVDDPSNADPRFDRTRVRRLLEANDWLDAAAIGRAAAHAGEADRALREITDWLWRERRLSSPAEEVWLDVTDLPRELRRRLAREALAAITPPSRAETIEPLLDSLEAGSGATQGGAMAEAKGAIWRFRKAPPRRSH